MEEWELGHFVILIRFNSCKEWVSLPGFVDVPFTLGKSLCMDVL